MSDVPAIHGLIDDSAGLGLMLFRSHNELYESIRDWVVCQMDGSVVGCCALNVVWSDLAEIKSLAVHPGYRGQGIASDLVQTLLGEAARLELRRVFALTYRQNFFERLGFEVVPKHTLPHKVWTDCVKCPKQHACDEIAVARTVSNADLNFCPPVPAALAEDLRPAPMG